MKKSELDSIYGAADMLSILDDSPKDTTAYVVDVSNPVCPCCGARLVLNDGLTAAETDNLATDNIQESYVEYANVIPLVTEVANDIVESCLDDDTSGITEQDLLTITDKRLRNVIHRKAIELKSILESSYDIYVQVEVLESHIRANIKTIVLHK